MPLTNDEIERINALHSYNILDSLEESDFDDLTTLASSICNTPIALVSLVNEKRQWFKSHIGLGTTETPIEQSFCAHAIVGGKAIIIVDYATKDERFYNNPLVKGDPHIVFYAGVPLVNEDGFTLGTLCVIDRQEKKLTPGQINSLKIIARQAMDKLELRGKIRLLKNSECRVHIE